MKRKPDILLVLVILFSLGMVTTGYTQGLWDRQNDSPATLTGRWYCRLDFNNPLNASDAVPASIGHGGLHGNIPAGHRQPINLLTVMSQAQQGRFVPFFAQMPECQATIIETASHAQTVKIQSPRFALARTVEMGLGDAETVAAQRLARINSLKRHMSARPAIEHGQVSAFASPLRFVHQGTRIYFPIIGQIKCDMPGTAKQRMLGELAVEVTSRAPLLNGAQLPAALA
jgi:hypothetical protein